MVRDAANVLRGKSPADGSVVSVTHLRKVYEPSPAWMRLLVRSNIKRSVVALDDVDLDVKAGQICVVLGPNGAGKTTTFRILVEVLGLDAHRESEEVRRLIGWMPADDRSLFLRMTCYENLYFHGRMQNLPRRELQKRIPTTLHQVGLKGHADSSAFSLSSGMRARLQRARALLHRPRLLVLDEPTASIDSLAAHALLELIVELVHEHQLAALISSHRLEEIEALHSHVVLLDRGRVLYHGNLDELRRVRDRPQLELRFAIGAGLTAAALLKGDWVHLMELSGDRLVCLPAPVDDRPAVRTTRPAGTGRHPRATGGHPAARAAGRPIQRAPCDRGRSVGTGRCAMSVALLPRTRSAWRMASAYVRLEAIDDLSLSDGDRLRPVGCHRPRGHSVLRGPTLPVRPPPRRRRLLDVRGDRAERGRGAAGGAVGLRSTVIAVPGSGHLRDLAHRAGRLELHPVRDEPLEEKITLGFLSVLVMLSVGGLLGADYDLGGIPRFLAVLALGVAACVAIGILSASPMVLAKRSAPVLTLYGLAASLLGGALFPLQIVPSWLRGMLSGY